MEVPEGLLPEGAVLLPEGTVLLPEGTVLLPEGTVLGERATLVQFSTAFCAPCRGTRAVLRSVAEQVPGVAYVEVDAERSLALVRRLDVRATPTTLVLDAAGREVRRATGQPSRAQVMQALP